MKRLFILATAATVALASCTKTQVVYNEAPQEIAFKQVANVMTKTTELTTDMGVFAVLSTGGTNYFSNIQFKGTGTAGSKIWKGNPTQYYPLQEALDFAFYAPYSDASPAWTYTSNDQTLKSSAYTDISETDVLFGSVILADKKKSENPYAVTLKHALAKVSIKIKTNIETSEQVKINSVTLNTVNKGGALTVVYQNDVLNSASWTSPTSGDYTWTVSQFATTTDAAYGDAKYLIAGNYGETETVEQTELVVNYTIKRDGTNEYTGSATLDLSPDAGKAYWEMGKHYIYTINASVYEITFDADVEDMTEVPNPDVEVK